MFLQNISPRNATVTQLLCKRSVHIMLLRKLGACEKLAYHLEQYNCCNFTLVAETTQLHPATFDKAVRLAIQQHPLLNTSITMLDNQLWFQEKKKNIFEISHAIYEKENEISSIININLTNSFHPQYSPMVTIQCLHFPSSHTKILLTFYHVISDSSAASCLLSDILKFYDILMTQSEVKLNRLSLREPIEALIGLDLYHHSNNDIFHNENNTAEKNLNLGITCTQIPLENIRRLLSQNKDMHLTVNHIMLSAAAFAMKEQVKNDHVILVSPVNVRRLLDTNIEANEFGYYLSRMDINANFKRSSTLTSLAKEIKVQSDMQLTKEYLSSTIEILSELSETINISESLFSSGIPTILLTNTGKADRLFKAKKQVELIDMQFYLAPQAIALTDKSYCIALTIYRQTVHVTVSYNKELINPVTADKFAEKIKSYFGEK